MLCGDFGIPWALGAHAPALGISQGTAHVHVYSSMPKRTQTLPISAATLHSTMQHDGATLN